jgi:hypothetical protein
MHPLSANILVTSLPETYSAWADTQRQQVSPYESNQVADGDTTAMTAQELLPLSSGDSIHGWQVTGPENPFSLHGAGEYVLEAGIAAVGIAARQVATRIGQ